MLQVKKEEVKDTVREILASVDSQKNVEPKQLDDCKKRKLVKAE